MKRYSEWEDIKLRAIAQALEAQMQKSRSNRSYAKNTGQVYYGVPNTLMRQSKMGRD
jgi:chitin synthase